MINPQNSILCRPINQHIRTTDELKEIRKTMKDILKAYKHMKDNPVNELKEAIHDMIIKCPFEPEQLIDEDNNTLAHICIKTTDYALLHLIIEIYISIFSKNDTFYTWFLMENNDDMTIFELSAKLHVKEIMQYLYLVLGSEEHGRLRILENRNNVFHIAAQENVTYPIIFFFEKLQKHHEDKLIIDIANSKGCTPLHEACYRGNKLVIDLLLDLGANINEGDKSGFTPLHYAVQSNNERCIKKLLVRGSNKMAESINGEIPYEIALERNYLDIAALLKKRNLCEKLFSKGNEIGPARGSRNNLMLLLLLMILILGKGIVIFRIAFSLNETEWQKELIPFVPDIIAEINHQYPISEAISLHMKDLIKCFEDNCIIEYSFTFISLINDLAILFVVVFFLCFAKRVFNQRKSKTEARSLLKLFDSHKTVCIKCRITMESDTIHCVVCNACVNNWDHHCFWLNTCINNANKKHFLIFVYTILCFLIMNTVFFGLNLLLGFMERYHSLFYSQLFGFVLYSDDHDKVENTTKVFFAQLAWYTLNAFFFFLCFYSLIFITIPITTETCKSTQSKEIIGQTLSEYQAKLLNNSRQSSGVDHYQI